MSYFLLCAVVFLSTYLINIFYITVLYHRGLAHGAVRLKPWARKTLIWSGSWTTGIDPKAWACMHRLHHRYSDSEQDPHSPVNLGIFGVILGQLHSYKRALAGLIRNDDYYVSRVRDLDFPVSWLNRNGIWWLPYAVHAVVALALGVVFHAPLLGGAYWLGIMSHPIQGWMVNSFAHRYGYRNFENGDQSRNNTVVAWLVAGEGYQNNHHAAPSSPKFSVRWFEVDSGFLLCRVARALGMIESVSIK